jgi:hypothetical protein
MADLKPIETKYAGCRFRSRLEARWAVFFDHLGVKWEYEKEGYDLGEAGWYLPDFWLPEQECWVEIKPSQPFGEDAVAKCSALAAATGHPCLLFGGNPPLNHERTGIAFGWELDGETIGPCPVTICNCQKCERIAISAEWWSRCWCAPGCEGYKSRCNATDAAAEAARSARFEHGESR